MSAAAPAAHAGPALRLYQPPDDCPDSAAESELLIAEASADPNGQLRALVHRLEVPDCECPLDLTCPCGESCPPGFAWSCHDCVLGVGGSGPLSDPRPPRSCAEHCPCCRGDCNCRPAVYQPPCQHVHRAGHGLSLAEWEQMLLLAAPGPRDPEPPGAGAAAAQQNLWYRLRDTGHAEPPAPHVPLSTLTRAATVEDLALRYERGLGLWHREDLAPADLDQRVVRRITHLRNGQADVHDLAVVYRPEDLCDEWEDAHVEALADLAARRASGSRLGLEAAPAERRVAA